MIIVVMVSEKKEGRREVRERKEIQSFFKNLNFFCLCLTTPNYTCLFKAKIVTIFCEFIAYINLKYKTMIA